MRQSEEIIKKSEGIIDRTGAQTILYLTCTTITSVDLAHYGVSRAKGWISVGCDTTIFINHLMVPSNPLVCLLTILQK